MAKRILIIDDDAVVVRVLALRLKLAGFETMTRFDAKSGLQAARDGSPDAIFVDRRLPDGDGVVVIDQLKQDPQTGAIPVIMVSGIETDRTAALAAGAASFLSKPYEAETMLSELRLALESSDSHA